MNPERTSPEPRPAQLLRKSSGARDTTHLLSLVAVLLFWLAPPCVENLPLKIRNRSGLLKLKWWFISSHLCSKGPV